MPKLGGSWITAFFLVGLLIGFRNPAVTRLRYFLLGCVVVLILAQALGRTQLSEESPEINSENLLVLLAPLVLVYGVSLFYLLLEQMRLPFRELRYLVIGIFSLVACLPMVFVFLPPKTSPVAYPPYYPPAIQTVAGWLKEKELAMSDIPWAVAWYGQRQCVWLTLKCTPDAKDPNTHEDFFAINDYQKPINAPLPDAADHGRAVPDPMDSRRRTKLGQLHPGKHGEKEGAGLLSRSANRQAGWLPEQLVLTDCQRWRKAP